MTVFDLVFFIDMPLFCATWMGLLRKAMDPVGLNYDTGNRVKSAFLSGGMGQAKQPWTEAPPWPGSALSMDS